MKVIVYRIIIGIAMCLFCANNIFAQKAERKQIREGNELYKNQKYTESEIAYRKSLEVNPRSVEGAFNLGNALYQQEKYPEATEQYQLVTAQKERLLSENQANTERLAQVYHNIGNIGMKNKEYAKSIEAYKQSLKINPKDDETRYNLALAQKLLKDQQQENPNQDQNNEDQQDEQQQNEDQKQDQDQQEPQQDEQQEEQQQNEQMSQDNAQQILDAFLQDEKETQEKVKQVQAQQQERRRTDKQW